MASSERSCKCADNWSQVLPINDQFSGVGAALKDSRLQGILKGTPNGATTLQYIMSDEKVLPGEEVITSGGDRIFPKGLPVGRVASVEPGKDLFLNIRVIPSARLDQIEEVLVVTKITEKMPDSKDLGPLRASDILAERLPTVPNKAELDAAGNAKPGSATPGTPPAGTTTPAVAGAHPSVSGTTPTKPATPAPLANKPATTIPRTTVPGTAGTAKPKPTQAAGTTTTAKPNNGAPAPTNGVRVIDNDAPATPRPKRTPPAETTPPVEQPATTPSGGASPQ